MGLSPLDQTGIVSFDRPGAFGETILVTAVVSPTGEGAPASIKATGVGQEVRERKAVRAACPPIKVYQTKVRQQALGVSRGVTDGDRIAQLELDHRPEVVGPAGLLQAGPGLLRVIQEPSQLTVKIREQSGPGSLHAVDSFPEISALADGLLNQLGQHSLDLGPCLGAPGQRSAVIQQKVIKRFVKEVGREVIGQQIVRFVLLDRQVNDSQLVESPSFQLVTHLQQAVLVMNQVQAGR